MESAYKVYKECSKGYEAECIVSDLEDLLTVMDILIKDEEVQKVLVIEHSFEEQYEFPIFLYTGNMQDYEEFKQAHRDFKKYFM